MLKKLTLGNLLAGIAIIGIVSSIVLPQVTSTPVPPSMMFSNDTSYPYEFIFYEQKTNKILLSLKLQPYQSTSVRYYSGKTLDWDTYPEGIVCIAKNLEIPDEEMNRFPLEVNYCRIFKMTPKGPVLEKNPKRNNPAKKRVENETQTTSIPE